MKKLENLGVKAHKDRPFEEIAYLIAIVYNVVNRKLEVLLRQYKLSVSKFNILLVLKFQGGDAGLSQKAVSDKLIVSDGNITGILDRMEKEKLVLRTQHPKDRRINLVRITLKGSDMVQDIFPKYEALLKESVDLISERQQKLLKPIFYAWAKKLL